MINGVRIRISSRENRNKEITKLFGWIEPIECGDARVSCRKLVGYQQP